MQKTLIGMTAAVLGALSAGLAVGGIHVQPEQDRVTMTKLPMDLPSIGDVQAVTRWQFGRVDRIQRRGASEITISIRIKSGDTVDVTGRRELFRELAQKCGWVTGDMRNVAGRSEYAERMIAFGIDDNGGMVAIISMEPFNRDRSRLRRAICG